MSGGRKMNSTNIGFSKIALAQHVVRRLIPEARGPAARAAGRNAMATRFALTPASPMVAVFAPAAPPRSSGCVYERRAARTFTLKNPAP